MEYPQTLNTSLDDLEPISRNDQSDVKSFSLGISRRPPIVFVKARSKAQEENQILKTQTSGKAIASFYRDLVRQPQDPPPSSLPLPPVSCAICGVAILDPVRHHLNSAHLSALSNPQAPVRPLSIGPSSSGYRYLVRHGWSPHDTKGLGAKGREGSRTPVQVDFKSDKVGIGLAATEKGLSGTKEHGQELPQRLKKKKKKGLSSADIAKRQDVENKLKRKRIYQDLYGDSKVNEYLGLEE